MQPRQVTEARNAEPLDTAEQQAVDSQRSLAAPATATSQTREVAAQDVTAPPPSANHDDVDLGDWSGSSKGSNPTDLPGDPLQVGGDQSQRGVVHHQSRALPTKSRPRFMYGNNRIVVVCVQTGMCTWTVVPACSRGLISPVVRRVTD